MQQFAKDYVNNQPWYDRVQFEIILDYKMFPGTHLSVREWFFNLHHTWDLNKENNNRYWIAGAIRILGLDMGVGFAWQRKFKE